MADRRCAQCGKKTTNRGPKSGTGNYYCSEPECQRAKKREAYRVMMRKGEERPDAPTICSNPECSEPLQPRKVRHGDIPGKRWCRKLMCQRQRMSYVDPVGEGPISAEELKQLRYGNNLANFLFTVYILENAKPCETCDLPAADGWMHPTAVENTPCLNIGGGSTLPTPVSKRLWPDLKPLPLIMG